MNAPVTTLAVAGCLLSGCGSALLSKTIETKYGESRVRNIVGVTSADIDNENITLKLNLECIQSVTHVYCNQRFLETHGKCMRKTTVTQDRPTVCDWNSYQDFQLTLTPPWSGEPASGVLLAGRIARFPVDWSRTGVDPLSPNARLELANGSWFIGTPIEVAFKWMPSEKSSEQMLLMIGEAMDTEVTVSPPDGPVALNVTAFTVEGGGALRTGRRAHLRLSVRNAGLGTAHRVIARTRSGIPDLHNLQFSFGILRPGEGKSRVIAVQVPKDAEASILILVLVEDANEGRASHKQRFLIMTGDEPGDRPRAACPAGLLTFSRYKERLIRIRAMLETGAITQQEFDEYEAALLVCLE
jgi:hypothetical protein